MEPEVDNYTETEIDSLMETEVDSSKEPEIDETNFFDILKESVVTTEREDGIFCVQIDELIKNISKRKITCQITGTKI